MGSVYVYVCGGLSAIGGLLFGYDIGVISGILTMPYFRKEFPSGPAKEGSIVASLLAGCFFGALAAGYLSDRIGRKYSVLVGSVVFVVGGILQASSTTFAQMYTGRVIAGLAVGELSMIVPLYQSEISPKEIRGRLRIFDGCPSYHYAMYFFHLKVIGTFFLPFSPRWLVDHDRDEEAITVLANLRSKGDRNATVVQEEFREIKETVIFEREIAAKSYWELLKVGPENIRRRVLLGVFIQAFQQLTGINAIMYYAPQIFSNAGLADNSSRLLATGVNGLVNMLATIPAIIWIDRLGRSILATHGTKYFDESLGKHFVYLDNKGSSYAVIVFIYVFVASFAYSWGPTGWIYPAEIFPIRGKAMSVTTACNWLFNFVIGLVVPILLDSIIWGTYLIFGIFCVLMAAAIYIFYPETKGKSLEEMDNLFGNVQKSKNLEKNEGELEAA
ncbi:15646_t:CDS:10 [Rhizophagus irregularis]|nr:15646_t:CDS:10 [Rhizophagus irregularis]